MSSIFISESSKRQVPYLQLVAYFSDLHIIRCWARLLRGD